MTTKILREVVRADQQAKPDFARVWINISRKALHIEPKTGRGDMTWHAKARRWIASLPLGSEITADDLLEAIGHPDETHAANGRNNAVGAAFADAHSLGRIETVGIRASRQPRRKGGMVRVWRVIAPTQPELL